MITALMDWKDRLLGRGDASITVPVFDGALKSNNRLEEAQVFATLAEPEDLATDGRALFVANRNAVLRFDVAVHANAHANANTDRGATEVQRFERPVTALACLADGGLAVALDGREVRIVGGAHDGQIGRAHV